MPGGLSPNATGALWMCAAMAGYTINDALMKLAFDQLQMFQSIFLRGIAATLLVGALAWRAGALRPVAARERRLIAGRALGELVSTVLFLTALSKMKLAGVSAVMQTAPIALTLVAVLFLGERVGWRRWGAILAGFLGVLMIVRPGAESFNPAALIAVAAMLVVCARDLITRRLDARTPSALAALASALAVTLGAGLASLIEGWRAPGAAALGALAAAAGFLVLGYIASIAAMRSGELSFVGLFRYTVFLWAIGLGWAVLGETPTALTLVGCAVIAAAGLVTVRRSHGSPSRAGT